MVKWKGWIGTREWVVEFEQMENLAQWVKKAQEESIKSKTRVKLKIKANKLIKKG